MLALSFCQLCAIGVLALIASSTPAKLNERSTAINYDENGVDVTWTQRRYRARVAVVEDDKDESKIDELPSEVRPMSRVDEVATADSIRFDQEEDENEEEEWRDNRLLVNYNQDEGQFEQPDVAPSLSNARPIDESPSDAAKEARLHELEEPENNDDLLVPIDGEGRADSSAASEMASERDNADDDTALFGATRLSGVFPGDDSDELDEDREEFVDRGRQTRPSFGRARRRAYRYHRTANQLPLGLSWWGKQRRSSGRRWWGKR